MSGFKEIWNEELEHVNKALGAYLDSKIEQVSRLGDWHREYYGNIREYMMRGGKRLRPILVAVAYKLIKDTIDVPHLYRAACSVEILHNGSLLHDDLIDHDEVRRGGKTFHAIYRDTLLDRDASKERADDFGMAMAILGGDSLLNMGSEAISASDLDADIAVKCLKYYQTAYQYLADGVLLEMTMVNQKDIKADTYLDMVALKTAVLFEKSLLIGASIARATESQLEALQEYGVKVGQAFQMQDDILGSFGDEEVTGKSADGDIKEGKKTMLVLKAYSLGTDEQRAKIDELLGKDDMSDAEVEVVRSIFKESGSLDATQKLMEQLLSEAQTALDKAEPAFNEKYKTFLIELSEFLTKRDF